MSMNNRDPDRWLHVDDQPLIDPLIPPFPRVVGRERELARFKHILCASGDETCITIIGLPGMGKTTLAAALVRDTEILEHFPDGILWAGLGACLDSSQHLTRWATLLGISATEIGVLNNHARKEAMRSVIGERRLLLILDDAWTVEDALAFQIGGPRCVHLVTTRFPSLAAQLTTSASLLLQELSIEQSLDLLHLLAPQVVECEASGARILVQALGGLPLALTLAGNYLRGQSYGKQTRRIQGALEQLKSAKMRLQLSEPRSPINRHPSLPSESSLSLHSVIALTDQSLSEDARTALYALSILPSKPDTFSEEAALAISADSTNVLDELLDTGLLERSGEHYALHQTIADYARFHLDSQLPQERLVAYAITFVETHSTDYELLDQESSTILCALEAAHTLSKHQELVRGVCTFASFLLLRGNYSLAHQHLLRAQQAALTLEDQHGLVSTYLYLGELAEKQGDYAQSQTLLEQGVTLARSLGKPERMCALLSLLGRSHWKRGHYPQAEAYLQEGLALSRQIGHTQRMSELLATLGAVAARRGDFLQSEVYLQEGLNLARQTDDRKQVCMLLMNLGVTISEQGQYEQACAYFEEGLALARQIGQYEWMSALLCNLGAAATLRGDYAQAEIYQREGLSIARQIGHREWMSILLLNLGETAVAQEKYIQATLYFQETVKLVQQLDRPQLTARALYELGNLHLKQQEIAEAEITFQEMFNTIPQGDLELHALSQYGFARLFAAQGNLQQARQLGESSAAAFEGMKHREAKQVRHWLASITTP